MQRPYKSVGGEEKERESAPSEPAPNSPAKTSLIPDPCVAYATSDLDTTGSAEEEDAFATCAYPRQGNEGTWRKAQLLLQEAFRIDKEKKKHTSQDPILVNMSANVG